MRPSHHLRAMLHPVPALTLAVLMLGTPPVRAQTPAASAMAGQKITVVVMPFEFAAPLPAQRHVIPPYRPPMWPPLPAPTGVGGASFPTRRLAHAPVPTSAPYPTQVTGDGPGDAIGVGIADLLVERLLEVPGFRVVERRRLDLLMSEQILGTTDSTARRDTVGVPDRGAMLRARYIITGSVTRFGTEERRGLGGVGGGFGLGALGFKRPKTQVALTARLIDATTGEVVASVSATGTSTKGGSVLIGGGGGGAGGGVAIGSGEFRASALGEATERAVQALAGAIAAKRERLIGPR
jgi:curli biogenesis system outer membrane secretion channel CsgG